MTFKTWLAKQVHRNDSIGDFARDACMDKALEGIRGRWQWMQHLKHMGANEAAVNAFDKAYKTFKFVCTENRGD
jgi:hypothetical protein